MARNGKAAAWTVVMTGLGLRNFRWESAMVDGAEHSPGTTGTNR